MLGMIFFENKLLGKPDVVFDSESNGRNFSSLASPGGQKKIIFNFYLQNDVTSRRWRFYQIFLVQMKVQKKFYNLVFRFEVKRPLGLLEIKFDFFLNLSSVIKLKTVHKRA